MSKRETPLTRRYWKEQTTGTLMEEFLAVRPSADQGQRLLDGVIVLDGQTRILHRSEHDPEYIRGKDIIVLQTKAERLGMYLLGQALFSRELMKRFHPKNIRTVAICKRSDKVLAPLAEKFGIEVVCYQESM